MRFLQLCALFVALINSVDSKVRQMNIFNRTGSDIRQTTTEGPNRFNPKRPNVTGTWFHTQQRGSPVRYRITIMYDDVFDKEDRHVILKAYRKIQFNTCLQFIRQRDVYNDNDTYISFQNRQNEGCYANFGKLEGKNIVNLEANTNRTCIQPEMVVHLLAHALGLGREPTSDDDVPTAFEFKEKISMDPIDPKYRKVIGNEQFAPSSVYKKLCILYGCQKCMGKIFDWEHPNHVWKTSQRTGPRLPKQQPTAL